jgi:hypothetical protein
MQRPADKAYQDGDSSVPGGAGRRGARVSRLAQVAVGVAIVALAVGWFVMSKAAEDTPSADAFSEAVGVALGLLIVASVAGAVLERRRGRARRS